MEKSHISHTPGQIERGNFFAKLKKGMIFVAIVGGMSALAQSLPKPAGNPWEDDYQSISGMEHYKSWGNYNVHDPAVMKVGDTYYMYSTDAIYRENRRRANEHNVPLGNIQVRSSRDLINWHFEGWAFDSIPQVAKNWVLEQSDNKGATNIWAPFPVQYKEKFRLYYCVSAFGLQTSYIGLAESDSPLGPWELKGCVVKTRRGDKMNAIDPSIITDSETGKMWMHYGSYFGGLYAMELKPETGLAMTDDDKGILTARRADYKKDNLEAPEIIYHPELKMYYLFLSYDPLMTTYNVRVGRSSKPEGPFVDFFGQDVRDTTNNYPIITHPYQFKNHPGWAGVAHCGAFANEKGEFFMVHQARLSPENHMMVLHVREIKWTKDGWPVVSPQRYAGSNERKISKKDISGDWEIIRINEAVTDRELEYGQILWGQNQLRKTEVNTSSIVAFLSNGKFKNDDVQGNWKFSAKDGLQLRLKYEVINNLIVFVGQDWENETETLLFTGLDQKGCAVWGKKIK